ncbi:transposase [Legionella oakridgensis]|nr:hypothetical protein LLB_1052 [Legionella longbeachae D-4968]VEE01541.1 transposase [Legionella oakridgensis]
MAGLILHDGSWSNLKEGMLRHQIYDKPDLRMIVEVMLLQTMEVK